METKRRAAPGRADGLDFVLSDESVGRDGLIIKTDGWNLRNFRKNPIALFSHDSRFPVGTWENVRTEGDRLIATLKLAARGTSQRIDELISLVEQGILRAVSVGFRVEDYDGNTITKQELTEASLVSVPALPSALAIARSLIAEGEISVDTARMVFGEHAVRDLTSEHRGTNGEHAATPPVRRTQTMKTLSQRVEDAQADLTRSKDTLTELNSTEPLDIDAIEELHLQIETQERSLAALKRSESLLAARAPGDGAPNLPGTVSREQRRPFAAPAQKIEPRDYLVRSLAARLVAHVTKEPVDFVRAKLYGEDDVMRTVFEHHRAASAPATTTTTGWAAELVQTVNADFLATLTPNSIFPGLSARGMRLTFGRNGVISIPYEEATPTIAGSFVAEGAPIPVRQGSFNATTLTPKKMAVISTFTREISEMSTPAIEGLIRAKIQRDTARAVDTVLLDATAASTIRPAGLRNGVSVTTATAGGGFDALVGDIKALVGALVTATSGNLRNPVWIMNPIQALAIGMTQNAGGDFPFAAEINGGRLAGFPLIVSGTVTAGMVILVDAEDFVSVTGDEPRFSVSDVATLHMEDTTPLAISSEGSPGAVAAAPIRSLWQTDAIGIRMILPMNWAVIRSGTVAWTQSVTW